MYHLINQRVADIAAAMLGKNRAGAVEEYNWLSTELRNRDVSTDTEYQRRFRVFWRIRCGDEWGRAYFSILEREKHSSSCDPVAVAGELLPIPSRKDKETLQFVFATKLAHMVNPHLPIYDSMVCTFFYLNPPAGATADARLQKCREIHSFLRDEYARVLRDRLLSPAIAAFRAQVPAAKDHTDEKIIDWLIWQFVDLAYREDWFARGLCRYG